MLEKYLIKEKKMDCNNGTRPINFDGFKLPISQPNNQTKTLTLHVDFVKNNSGEKEDPEVDKVKLLNPNIRHVISYKTRAVHGFGSERGRHCIYLEGIHEVKGKKTEYWVGTNSWGKDQKHPQIPFKGAEVRIARVEFIAT